jgi:type IX secretion system PorP/SprF family membrane protein
MKRNLSTYKVILLLLLVTCMFKGTYSQQVPVYSQYMFNKFLINPAIAGSEGYVAFNLTAREQWVGFKDAPYTHALCGQTRVSPRSWLNRVHQVRTRYSRGARISNVGLGGYIFNDHRGALDQTGMQLTYAYHLNLDERQLSFGVSVLFYQYSINKDKLILADEGDELIENNKLKMIVPDFNFGVYFTAYEYYAGISVAQLAQSTVRFTRIPNKYFQQKRSYYLIGGYRFKINRDYSIEPSLLFKTTETFNYQLDIGARAYHRNNYWGGLAFRTGGALIVTGGVRYDKFYFGYGLDLALNRIQSNSYGSHEFMVTYKFGQSVRSSYKWLERY